MSCRRGAVALGVGEPNAGDADGGRGQDTEPDGIDLDVSPRCLLQRRDDVSLQLLGREETRKDKGRHQNEDGEPYKKAAAPLEDPSNTGVRGGCGVVFRFRHEDRGNGDGNAGEE